MPHYIDRSKIFVLRLYQLSAVAIHTSSRGSGCHPTIVQQNTLKHVASRNLGKNRPTTLYNVQK